MVSKPDPAPQDWGKPAVEAAPPVKVRCITYTRPWTDVKWLDAGEEAMVPASLAEAMLKNRQVELVEEEKSK